MIDEGRRKDSGRMFFIFNFPERRPPLTEDESDADDVVEHIEARLFRENLPPPPPEPGDDRRSGVRKESFRLNSIGAALDVARAIAAGCSQ